MCDRAYRSRDYYCASDRASSSEFDGLETVAIPKSTQRIGVPISEPANAIVARSIVIENNAFGNGESAHT